MPVTRAQLRDALVTLIRSEQSLHLASHDRSEQGPWPLPGDYEERRHRSETELVAESTDPESMRVLVRSAMRFQNGLEALTWPIPDSIEEDRYSPYFRSAIGSDYRIDLLYMTHYNVLKIAEGTEVILVSQTSAEIFAGAVLPDLPDRGVPLTYVILFGDTTEIHNDALIDVRPLIVRIAEKDIDVDTWQITQDFSLLCDSARTSFEFDLPVAGNRAMVKMNGVVQQPGSAYTISGGSLSLTFVPYIGEVLTAGYEMGQKDEYSGWGMTPWGTGLYGV